jgi:hypothetical protein
MPAELSFTITRIEPEAGDLHVTVEWAAREPGGERTTLLVDTLAIPLPATRAEIEAAVRQRARSYVRPRFLDARPDLPPEQLALVGKERLVSELEVQP